MLVLAIGYYITSYLAPSLPVYLENCVRKNFLCCVHIIFIFKSVFLQFNENSLQIGLLYGASSLLYLFSAIPVGLLIDRVVSDLKCVQDR